MPEPEPTLSEETFAALNDYVARLHAGGLPDRGSLLERHPELESALDCLEILEALAPADDEPALHSPVPRAGSDFGGYELLAEIGRGGMGVVFKARQKSLGRFVALKLILADRLSSPEHVQRFQTEALAMAASGVRHPGVVAIYEAGEVEGQQFLAMELVEGPSLAELLRAGPIDPQQAARWLRDVALALDHLHRQGVIHRDVKPSNILIDAEGQPRLTDFGLAKLFAADSKLTHSGMIAGTPAYMPPEQAGGHAESVTPASDVYSLGAILYELLTGRPPFVDENLLNLLMQVLENEPARPRQLARHAPRDLEQVCLKCLEKRPADRYATAGELAADLDRFLRGEAVAIRPPGLGQRLWRWTRRQPALAVHAGTLAVFYGVELVNHFLLERTTSLFHGVVSGVVLAWLAASVGLQRLLEPPRDSIAARFVWGGLDVGLLFVVLLAGSGAASPLVAAYPLLVVLSGLWFRVRVVWFVTALSIGSYLVLVWENQGRQGVELPLTADRHLLFLASLAATGLAVAYQVHRIRCLSRYFERARTTNGSA